mmetsp:Transcript_59449/g.140639  ORF Transcript_59449/g.140639 Transcript_59449/m.140639 type:complete len:306 (+) Transcript_59449:1652-2569(+)
MGGRHIAVLHRHEVLDRLAAHRLLDRLDEAHQLDGRMVADVEHAVGRAGAGRVSRVRVVGRVGRRGAVQHPHDAFGDVVDVGEVADHLAVVEHVDRPPLDDGLGEQEQRHVRPAPGPVHREEAQPRRRQAEQVRVGMRHQLIGLLGGGVQADRVVDAVVFAEGHQRVAAVHAGAGRIGQVLHAAVAAAFQDVGEADDVAVDVGVGVLDRVAHPGLRRQVHHPVEALFGKQLGHALAVGHVHLHEAEARLAVQARQAVLLELGAVVVVEVVQAHHFVAARQQDLADMHADEAGGAGDEYFHLSIPK